MSSKHTQNVKQFLANFPSSRQFISSITRSNLSNAFGLNNRTIIPCSYALNKEFFIITNKHDDYVKPSFELNIFALQATDNIEKTELHLQDHDKDYDVTLYVTQGRIVRIDVDDFCSNRIIVGKNNLMRCSSLRKLLEHYKSHYVLRRASEYGTKNI